MSYDDWKCTDTTNPDPQCDLCGRACLLEELDINGNCERCVCHRCGEPMTKWGRRCGESDDGTHRQPLDFKK